MLLLGLGLFAQTGLYFLSYDDTITEADSILTDQGFQVANDNTGNLIRYYPMNNPKIKVVSLIMNPDFKTVAGWQVVYNADNSEADDNYVFQQLTKIKVESSPVTTRVAGATWVKPTYIAQVAFRELTNEGLIRQGVFHGIREDLSPKDVGIEPVLKTESALSTKGQATPKRGKKKR